MPKMLEVSILGKVYKSISEASRYTGISSKSIYSKLDSMDAKWADWHYVDDGRNVVKEPKKYPFAVSYRFIHIPTGCFYVGSTKDLNGRKATHLWNLKSSKHRCKKLQELWNKDSNEKNWQWLAIIFDQRQEAYDHEQETLSEFNNNPLLLNSVTNARSPISDVMLREGFRERAIAGKNRALNNMSEDQRRAYFNKILQGPKNRWSNPETRKAWKGAGNPFAKKVSVDGVVYGSVKEAMAALKIDEKTIRKRANHPDYPNYTFDVK